MSISVETLALAKKYTKDYVEDHPGGGDIVPAKSGTITIGTNWSGDGPYTQLVSITGYTATSKTQVNLYGDPELHEVLKNEGVQRLFIKNDNGVFTAIAEGKKPTTALTVNATFMEVK